jgi:hypothetical protein
MLEGLKGGGKEAERRLSGGTMKWSGRQKAIEGLRRGC